jgi:type VI secretion system secreted protein Hcp
MPDMPPYTRTWVNRGEKEERMKKHRVGGAALAAVFVAAALALAGGVFGRGAAHAAPAAQAANVGTLTVQGLQGASSLDLQSFSWGVKTPVDIGSSGGGAGAGKATFQEVTVQRSLDAVSPRFVQAASTGQHFPSATIEVATGKGTTMRYAFNTVFVTSVQHSSNGDGAVESLSLLYGAVQVEAVP